MLPTHLYAVDCDGSEESVFDCPSNEVDARCQQQQQDASVICQGLVRGKIN